MFSLLHRLVESERGGGEAKCVRKLLKLEGYGHFMHFTHVSSILLKDRLSNNMHRSEVVYFTRNYFEQELSKT